MCLNPIAMPRLTGSGVAIIPCGHCAECLKQKSQELMIRTVREVEYFKDFFFTTLTYDNDHIPMMVSDFAYDNNGEEHIISQTIVDDNDLRKQFFENANYTIQISKKGQRVRRYEPLHIGTFNRNDDYLVHRKFVYFTLDNEDWKKFLKKAKISYSRHFGKSLPKFKYLCVPEYGGASYRPHYHILWLGLNEEQVGYLMSKWDKGETKDIKRVKYSMYDMSKVATYVSDYACKGSYDCPYIKDGNCRKPHRCFSLDFGVGDEDELLRRGEHWKCTDMFGSYDINDLSNFGLDTKFRLAESVMARRYYDLNGFKYAIPQYLKKRIFYVPRKDLDLQKLTIIQQNKQYITDEEREKLDRRLIYRKVVDRDGKVSYKVIKPNLHSKVASELQTLVTDALFKHLNRYIVDSVERELTQEVQSLVAVTPEDMEQLQSAYVDSLKAQEKVAELHLLNKLYRSDI